MSLGLLQKRKVQRVLDDIRGEKLPGLTDPNKVVEYVNKKTDDESIRDWFRRLSPAIAYYKKSKIPSEVRKMNFRTLIMTFTTLAGAKQKIPRDEWKQAAKVYLTEWERRAKTVVSQPKKGYNMPEEGNGESVIKTEPKYREIFKRLGLNLSILAKIISHYNTAVQLKTSKSHVTSRKVLIGSHRSR